MTRETRVQKQVREYRKREDSLYDLLVSIADDGQACPPNPQLAKHIGCSHQMVSRMLTRMKQTGRIDVQQVCAMPRGWSRIVTIGKTGAKTADPRTSTTVRRPTCEILEIVARVSAMTVEEISGRRSTALYLRPRLLFTYFATEYGWGVTHVGRAINRDHSTVRYQLRVFPKKLETDRLLRRLYERTRQALDGFELDAIDLPPLQKRAERPKLVPAIERKAKFELDDDGELVAIAPEPVRYDPMIGSLRREHPGRCAA